MPGHTVPPLTVTFARLARFPDGIIHLVPEPDTGLGRLTADVRRRWALGG